MLVSVIALTLATSPSAAYAFPSADVYLTKGWDIRSSVAHSSFPKLKQVTKSRWCGPNLGFIYCLVFENDHLTSIEAEPKTQQNLLSAFESHYGLSTNVITGISTVEYTWETPGYVVTLNQMADANGPVVAVQPWTERIVWRPPSPIRG